MGAIPGSREPSQTSCLGPSGFDPERGDAHERLDGVTADELRRLIAARLAVRGEPSRLARGVGLTDETVLAFLRGARDPADALLHTLGWRREYRYFRVERCGCHACTIEWAIHEDPLPGPASFDPRLCRMFLCETCGNKRCPHAADHRNACTGSNEPGQPGSLYGSPTACTAIAMETQRADTPKSESVAKR
jgi:hypothetical protein